MNVGRRAIPLRARPISRIHERREDLVGTQASTG